MYEADTILTLKQQRDPDPETGEEFPYNVVKVVGPSPINHGTVAGGEWDGSGGEGVIVTPVSNFGSTLDEPYGKLAALYDVTSTPETTVEVAPPIRVINSTSNSAGPTPEEQFAEKAPGVAPEPGQTRGRTPVSPLPDPRPKASDGPLGPVPPTNPDATPVEEIA